jgi:hypothetical protein
MMVTVGVLLVWGGSGRAHAEAGPASKVDYVTQIKPILKSRCYACHGALKQKANLRLDAVALARTGGDSGPAWEPGQPAASPILERIAATDDAERMPPDGKPLTAEQIALLTAWISQGAAAPANDAPEADPREHWAFQKPRRPELPAATPEGGGHPLDRLLAAEWAARGLTPVGAADPATLLRRVSFDLIGLPPTRDELHAFLADTSPDAYARAVERLLASPHYGERWGRHWMDVWRYSDWYGRRSVPDVMNSYPQIWRWRDWILRSLNEDKGYDRMLVEMLAADEVAPDDQQNVVATGFIVRNWFKWNYDTWLRDQVEHTGKAFLGLSFNCALCHDHKYDPISQSEYFQLRAVFEPLELRHDRLAGEPDPGPFQKYIYGKPYGPISNGLIRVFDEKLDAETFVYRGGDQRNKIEGRPAVAPGVPAFLGGDAFRVEPIDLPVTSWNPGLRAFVEQEETAKRQAAVSAAEAGLAAARTTLESRLPEAQAAALKAEGAWKAAVQSAAGEQPQAKALGGTQSLLLDATQGRRALVHPLSNLKPIESSAVISFLVRVLRDSHFNLQLALDRNTGATGGWVGFENGKILTYQPGGFVQVEAGRYEPADGEKVFAVTLRIDVEKNQFALTVVRTADQAKLVENFPAALNGWRAAQDNKQGLFLDARPGTSVLFDDLVIRPIEGEAWVVYDFEPPKFPVGRDVAGIEGWLGSAPFSAAPAVSSVVRSVNASPALKSAELELTVAQRKVDAVRLGVTAAEARAAAARAELAAFQSRLAAERARFVEQAPQAEARAVEAAAAERQATLQSAAAQLAAAEKALADAEGKPAADAQRAAEIAKAAPAVAAAQAAVEAARLATAKTDGVYSPLGPVYPRQSTGRRAALAHWLTSRENPLTARVAVNHIWQRHFGRPLVETPANFGRSGKAPSHPQVLDWLAVELMENGWSMKHLHRLIVTSQAYRRTSHADAAHPGQQADPENRWLWRFTPARLEAEVIRDSVLFVAGQLDPALGGPEIAQDQGLVSTRRSMYFSHHGESRMEFLELFDAASPVDCYQRTTSILPQQALALSNSELTRKQSRTLAGRIWAEIAGEGAAPVADAERQFVAAAFEQVLSRSPSPPELEASLKFLERQQAVYAAALPGPNAAGATPGFENPALRSRASFVHALFNHNDFITVR